MVCIWTFFVVALSSAWHELQKQVVFWLQTQCNSAQVVQHRCISASGGHSVAATGSGIVVPAILSSTCCGSYWHTGTGIVVLVIAAGDIACECCQMWLGFLVGGIKLAWAWAWVWAWAWGAPERESYRLATGTGVVTSRLSKQNWRDSSNGILFVPWWFEVNTSGVLVTTVTTKITIICNDAYLSSYITQQVLSLSMSGIPLRHRIPISFQRLQQSWNSGYAM